LGSQGVTKTVEQGRNGEVLTSASALGSSLLDERSEQQVYRPECAERIITS